MFNSGIIVLQNSDRSGNQSEFFFLSKSVFIVILTLMLLFNYSLIALELVCMKIHGGSSLKRDEHLHVKTLA